MKEVLVMKKRILPIILLVLCAALTLSACTMIKEPATLKGEFESKGYIVRHYSSIQSGQFKTMIDLIQLEDGSGITDIIIADGGENGSPKPLIVFYCNSSDTTKKVFDAAKKSLDAVAKFTKMKSPEDCNILTEDNAVIIGDHDMIELAKV